MIGDIDRVGFGGVRAGCVDFLSGPSRIRLAPADGGDPRAFAGQTNGDGMTDPPPRSRHDCDLILESHMQNILTAEIAEDAEENKIIVIDPPLCALCALCALCG
jgi:NAD-dependent dihydropyrimidine dehydrogenase PreA subunit